MANPRRVLRLQQVILETVARVIQQDLRDPRIGMVSITRVQLAADLSTATIGWSMIGEDAEVRTCERGLEHATPHVQRAVAAAMQTRTTPQLRFRHDHALNRAQELESIFETLRQERAQTAATKGDEEAESGAAHDNPDAQVDPADLA